MPDYTIGIAERIASVADSTATSNSVNRNYFQETSQSVVNVVNVAITPAAPTALDPTPDTTYATATDGDSVSTFGVQETPIVITLLATIEDAGALAEYLIRSVPAFWFSNLAISLNTLSEANKNIVANLEIGQQIAVTKTFPAGVVPQSVTEVLFVEGISHRVTPETHVVTIYTGPATTYLQWTLSNYLTTTTRTNFVTNPNFETNTTGWGNATGATNTRTSSTSVFGSWCISQTRTTTGNLSVQTNPRINATPGTTYTISGYFRRDYSTTRLTQIRIQWFNASSVLIGSTLTTTITPPPINTWERFSFTATAPATTATIFFDFFVSSAIAGETIFVDGVLFEEASSALPYFDGTYSDTYTGYTLLTQQWNGTADASSSTATWGLNSSQTGSPLNDSTYGLA
jgi:hypothetical protein